ncbi:MAG: ribonucleotide reductase N-terminal alpha domain-containing protein [bacterium]|nr:ribonucleotide reductase N-terminal alpha domain-containing protein [bacterium]
MSRNTYNPTKYARSVLITGKITAIGESPQQMFERVVKTIFDVEKKFNTPNKSTKNARSIFAEFVAGKAFTPGTPTLTNAGRKKYDSSALSSCAIIPVNLRNKTESAKIIRSYYYQNMGSGFDLSDYKDPVSLLLWLNDLSVKETKTGKYDRYIGNMANLNINHPKIRKFISAKRKTNLLHFNLSVNINDKFMDAAMHNQSFKLSNGNGISAKKLLREIAECEWFNGEPSLINLDRMNKHNPVSNKLPYTTTPPCAEMGMATGETCQFGYINIRYFVKPSGIEYPKLEKAVISITRALDNALEIGLTKYPNPLSTEVARYKRKIGIAISGIADTLLYYSIPYDTEKARILVRDIASFVNYTSKVASYELACERGSCGAMSDTKNNKYFDNYLIKRFNKGSNTVSTATWKTISDKIKSTGKLRNLTTTAIPPAARVSILMDTSQGIEPMFGVLNDVGEIPNTVKAFVSKNAKGNTELILKQAIKDHSFQKTDLPKKARNCLKTAREIKPREHIKMIAALAGKYGVVDEGVSKTVNLPNSAKPEDIEDIIYYSHKLGIKNIAVYRDGSITEQPKSL